MIRATRGAAAELARLLDAATPASGPVAELAGLARRLQATAPALAASAVPRPEFRAQLRTRLVAVAAVQAHRAAAPVPPVRAAGLEAAVSWSRALRARRGARVAVGAMASVVVVSGVGVAGAQSLPGQPFYGVKTAAEALQLRTADGLEGKGRVHLQQAARRLDEVSRLTRDGGGVALEGPAAGSVVAGGVSSRLVVDTLAAMDASTRAGRRLLLRASRDGADPRPLAELTTFASHQDQQLSRLVPDLPTGAQARAQESLALVEGVGDDALTLLLDRLPDEQDAVVALPPVPAPALPSGEPSPAGAAVVPVGTPPSPRPARTAAPAAPVDPEPEPAPSGDTTSPAPAPSPAASPSAPPLVELPLPALPLPLPLPVPVPTSVVVPPLPSLPLPLPTSLPTGLPSLPALPSAPSMPGFAPPAN